MKIFLFSLYRISKYNELLNAFYLESLFAWSMESLRVSLMEFVFIGSILGSILDFAALTQMLGNTRIYQKSLHLTLILVSSYLSRFLLSLFYLASVNYFLSCRLSNAFQKIEYIRFIQHISRFTQEGCSELSSVLYFQKQKSFQVILKNYTHVCIPLPVKLYTYQYRGICYF